MAWSFIDVIDPIVTIVTGTGIAFLLNRWTFRAQARIEIAIDLVNRLLDSVGELETSTNNYLKSINGPNRAQVLRADKALRKRLSLVRQQKHIFGKCSDIVASLDSAIHHLNYIATDKCDFGDAPNEKDKPDNTRTTELRLLLGDAVFEIEQHTTALRLSALKGKRQ